MSAAVAAPADFRAELTLFRRWPGRLIALIAFVFVVLLPLSISDNFTLSLLTTSGVAAIGALGLNVVTGYAGQVSLGHAFFLSVGSFTAVGLGSEHGLPMIVWLPGAVIVGALVGAAVGPFAARLKGIYLLVVTLGLVYLGIYVFTNWKSLSGGVLGTSVNLPLSVGFLDFNAPQIGGTLYTRGQGLCMLVWLFVGLALLITKNITRSRFGRAMRAIHDAQLSAEVAGVSPLRTKIGAFAIAGGLAGLAGAFYADQISYVSANEFDTTMSVQYVVMIIIGGIATTYGPIIGALIVSSLPLLISHFSSSLPFIKGTFSQSGFGFGAGDFSQILYGALLIFFLVVEPRGLVALFGRLGKAGRKLFGRARAPESSER